MKRQKEKYLLSFATNLNEKKYLILVKVKNAINFIWWKKINTKLVKQTKIVFVQPRAIENPNTFDIKSAIIEHLKSSNKFYKTLKQAG